MHRRGIRCGPDPGPQLTTRTPARPLLILIAAVPLCTCLPPGGHDANAPGGTAIPAAARDHLNTAYSIGGTRVQLVDGVSEVEAAPGSAARIVTRYLGNEARLDLNADGREDIVFLLTQQTGGSGTFYYVVAALAAADGYQGSSAFLLGDRVVPRSTEPQPNGSVVVSFADRAPGEGFATAPAFGRSVRLRLDAATLSFVEVPQDIAAKAFASSVAEVFLEDCIRNGITNSRGAQTTPARA